MGTINQGPHDEPVNIHHDLRVTQQDFFMVFPSQETERKSMFLSNIDQILNFNVRTVHFFAANSDFPPDMVAKKLKAALSKVLVPYDFLAGRLKLNPQSGRLEIDCNAAGVAFVVASSEYSLNEIGDLVYPNPAFGQLLVQSLGDVTPDDAQPLCTLQVTSFKCGGFAMGLSNNHATFDGISFKIFLQNLASQAFDDNRPLAVHPCNDRHLLTARSPPRVTFAHPELLKLEVRAGQEQRNPPLFDCPKEDLDFRIFRLSSDDVVHLKDVAKAGSAGAKISGFNVITAHIWRCRALSCDTGSENHMDRQSTVLYAVDIRPRLQPPLPGEYTGNAVLSSYATASCKELEEGPLGKVVEMLSEGAARMTDEYARSVIDWKEVNKGFPHGELLISSWWRLGFAEVEYPWGKPKYSCPVVYRRKDIILLFPEIDGVSSNGVNVLVALPPQEMEKFRTLFYKFMP